MFEDSGFCDEVIITATGEAYTGVIGKAAIVVGGQRDEDGIWYSAYVPGEGVCKVRASETVPTGRRLPAALAV